MRQGSRHITSSAAPAAAQSPAGIGHNGGPKRSLLDWFRLVGPREPQRIEPFQCGAPWTGHATIDELRDLARLQAKIDRAEHRVAEMKAQRRRVMMRCVRRMRRGEGKA